MADGFKIADAYVEVEARLEKADLVGAIVAAVDKAAPDIRDKAGKKIGSHLTDGITDTLGVGMKSAVTTGVSALGGASSALAGNPVTASIGIAIGAAIGVAMIGAIASVLTSGLALLAGAAVLGIGVAIASQNKKIQDQWKKSWGAIQKTLQKAVKPLIKPLLEAMKDLEDIVRGLGPELTALFKAVAPLLKLFTGQAMYITLREIIKGLTDAMPGIRAAFEGMANALPRVGKALGDFFRILFQDKDLIKRTTEGLFDFIAGLITWSAKVIRFFAVMWGAVTNFVTLLKAALSDDLTGALASFELFSGGALGRIAAAWAPLKKAIGEIWDALVKFANADDELEMSKAYITLVDKIKAAWVPLKAFIGVIWDEILAVVKKWWNEKFMPWWENTAKPWLIEKIKGMAGAAFEYLKTEALKKAKEVPGKVLEGIKNLASDVKADIVRQFSNAKDWLFSAGKSILQGLLDGIKDKIDDLKSLLQGVTNLIPDWKGPMAVDRKLLYPTGQAIMGGLESGMVSQFGSLESTLAGLTAALPGMAAQGGDGATAGGLTLNFDGANFYGVPDREFVAMLYDLLDRYRKGYR